MIGRKLDPTRRSKKVEDFERQLRHLVVGQDSAVNAFVDVFQMFEAGLNRPRRPIANLLFLGPTGTGKTRTAEAVVETLIGPIEALIKIDCAEFQHDHEIAKLLGSPPAYLGHQETPSRLRQATVNKYHTDNLKLTVVLFDEIEKASESLWQLLLGITDKGTLTLGNNETVDLSCCIFIMTSNLGAVEMSALLEGRGFGRAVSAVNPEARLQSKIEKIALEAAKRKFSPEFMNRIDKTVVFNPLNEGDFKKILELELNAVQQHILSTVMGSQFLLKCNQDVKDLLIREGISLQYGGRELKRVIDRRLVFPLSSLLSTGQIRIGDCLRAEMEEDVVSFVVEQENALVPLLLAKYSAVGLRPASTLPQPAKEETKTVKDARERVRVAEEKLQKTKELERRLDEIINDDPPPHSD